MRGAEMESPQVVLVLLHGFGCRARDLRDLVDRITASCPTVLVVTPEAAVLPITAHGGASCRAWYDYMTEFGSGREDLAGEATLRLAVARIGALIGQCRAKFPGARICAAGISQGGCLAIELAARGLVSAVFSMVAHPLTAGGRSASMRLEACGAEWHSLLAAADSVFSLEWMRRLHRCAQSVTVVEGDHWLSDDVLGAWLTERLEKYSRTVKSASCPAVNSAR